MHSFHSAKKAIKCGCFEAKSYFIEFVSLFMDWFVSSVSDYMSWLVGGGENVVGTCFRNYLFSGAKEQEPSEQAPTTDIDLPQGPFSTHQISRATSPGSTAMILQDRDYGVVLQGRSCRESDRLLNDQIISTVFFTNNK